MTVTASPTPVDVHSEEPVARTAERFQTLFNQMCARQIGSIGTVYSPDVQFTDPFTSVQGLDALGRYLDSAYGNVIGCRFDFGRLAIDDDQVAVPWVMYLRHKRLRGGQEIRVDGISHLVVRNQRVIMHRDYFDAGQLLYENLPLLGRAVRFVRGLAS